MLGGAAVAALAWFTIVTEGFAAPDESWFLQVVARLQSGDTLYRDVYFNATPLSVYVTLGLTSIFPPELTLVRAVVAAALVGTIVFCWLVCRTLRVGWIAAWLLVCAWNRPAPYTPLAMMCFAAAFYATVVWVQSVEDHDGEPKYLAFAAVAAGLCFGAKQNLGLYCLGALLLSILITDGHRSIAVRRSLVVLAVCALTSLAIMLPVYVSGGFDRFAVYGFAKGAYLETGAVPYAAAAERFRAAVSGVWSFEAFAAGYRELAFLLPPVVFGLLAVACVRGHSLERRTTLVVTVFVAAGYLVVYPRPGGSSIIYAMPLVVTGLAYGWSRVRSLVPPRWALAIRVAISVLFLCQIGLRFVRDTTALVSTEYVTSDIPHFRAIRVRDVEQTRLWNEARWLSGLAAERPLFLIGPNAGFFYLAADLRNPAAFDFPYVSVFGRTGQQEVIAQIAAGEIQSVFIFSTPVDRQTPVALQDFVRSAMVPVREEPLGVLYRSGR